MKTILDLLFGGILGILLACALVYGLLAEPDYWHNANAQYVAQHPQDVALDEDFSDSGVGCIDCLEVTE